MRVCLVVLAMTAACGYPPLPGLVLDASTDAPLDAPPTQFGTFIKVRFNSTADIPTGPPTQFGTFIKVRFNSTADIPTGPPTLAADVDTNTSPLCNAHNDQPTYCVIAGTTITIPNGMTIRAHGARPLVLLAIGAFDLEGAIDVSSRRTQAGTGRPPGTACLGNRAAAGHGGGFGGSFGGDGGMGGMPAMTTGSDVAGLPGIAVSLPGVLQSGCPGGQGAGNGGASGTGGSGGGAVAIIADSIHLNGQINASGAGGRGGAEASGGGGGGGGSGGMIVLDAPVVDAGSGPGIQLYANGGGGGQGGTATGTGQGPGDDGMESPDPGTQALGGANTNRSGGHGGDGSAGTSRKTGNPATTALNSGNGGGGGGGTGFIRAPMISGVTYAPTPTTP